MYSRAPYDQSSGREEAALGRPSATRFNVAGSQAHQGGARAQAVAPAAEPPNHFVQTGSKTSNSTSHPTQRSHFQPATTSVDPHLPNQAILCSRPVRHSIALRRGYLSWVRCHHPIWLLDSISRSVLPGSRAPAYTNKRHHLFFLLVLLLRKFTSARCFEPNPARPPSNHISRRTRRGFE